MLETNMNERDHTGETTQSGVRVYPISAPGRGDSSLPHSLPALLHELSGLQR